MFAYYCASLESSLKAGGSQTKPLPQPGPAAVGFGCSLQLAGQPLRMDQTDSAWWARGSELMAWRTRGAGAKHDSGLTAGLMSVADTPTHTHAPQVHTRLLPLHLTC